MSRPKGLRWVVSQLSEVFTPGEKRRFFWLTWGSVLLSVSEAFSIGILIPIMGLVVDPEGVSRSALYAKIGPWLGPGSLRSHLGILMGAAIILFWLKSAYALFMLKLQQEAIGDIRVRLKGEIMGRYLAKPYAFHLMNHSAALFKNVISEVSQFAVGFLAQAVAVVSEGFIVLGIFALLLAAYPVVTLVAVFFLGAILALLHVAVRRPLEGRSVEREIYNEQKHKTGLEALGAVKEIQVCGAQSRFRERFVAAVAAYSKSHVSFTVFTFVPRYVLEAALFTAIMGGLLLALRAEKSVGELVPMLSVFALAALRLLPSVNKIQQGFNTAMYYRNSLDLVHGVLTEAPAPQPPASSAHFPAGPQEIRLNGASFAYPGRPALFKDLDFAVPARATVALVGESGSGKSTLTDLLMGILEPQEGELSYGGVRVSRANAAEYWRRLAYVPQQIALLDDTIASNISFGSSPEEVGPDRLNRAVEAAQLSSLVEELPQGLETRIGEKGVRLSGGQRQRVGIARALLREPEVLVLDEATSSLDSQTEAQIDLAVRRLRGRLTVVIIAHRLSTVENADLIFVLDKGRVADRGTYEELLERSPAFQKLARVLVPKA